MKRVKNDTIIVNGVEKKKMKVKVTIAFFDGKERRRETREIYRYC